MRLSRARASLRSTAHRCRQRLAAGRLILLLLTASLAVMPITERLWSWDAFILSGHDLEFSVIGALTVCGLCMLIAHQVVASPLLLLIAAYFFKAPPVRSLLTRAGVRLAATPATPADPPTSISPRLLGIAPLGAVPLRL